MTKWGRSPLGKVIAKIDRNTRAIAKLASAEGHVFDDETWGAGDQSRAAGVLNELRFALLQERRNLKLVFEEEFARSKENGGGR